MHLLLGMEGMLTFFGFFLSMFRVHTRFLTIKGYVVTGHKHAHKINYFSALVKAGAMQQLALDSLINGVYFGVSNWSITSHTISILLVFECRQAVLNSLFTAYN